MLFTCQAINGSPLRLKDAIEVVEIETANGIVESEVFEVKQIKSMRIIKGTFPIQVYDFLAHGIFSNYDGLLGLDFLKATSFVLTPI